MRKRGKRIWSILGITIGICVMMSFSALAADETSVASGTCGEGITWSLDRTTGIMTLTGNGTMEDFNLSANFSPWSAIDHEIKEVVFSSGIESIGSYAFYSCSNLTKVTFSSTLKYIGDSAFAFCGSLTDITLPDGLLSIGSRAFENCLKLSSVKIPESVIDIMGPSGPFIGCTNLTSTGPVGGDYNIQFGWKNTIPAWAFGNSNITSVVLPDGISKIESYAFANGKIESIVLPKSLEIIEDNAFGLGQPNLKTAGPIGGDYDIQFGWDTKIPDYAFNRFDALMEITLPDRIEIIGNSAFSECDIEYIELPSGLTHIGEKAFSWCKNLTAIDIPNNVQFIGDGAFYDCDNLTNVTMPAVVYHEDNGETLIGCSSFEALEQVTLNGAGELKAYEYGTAPWRYAKTVYLSEGISAVGEKAFQYSNNLKQIFLPSTLTSIGASAFYGCTSLTNIDIPENVHVIGESAFNGCSDLLNIDIPQNVEELSEKAFFNCDSLEYVIIPDSVVRIDDSTFSGCDSLMRITIPSSVTSIGDSAFSDCDSLTSITIPSSVTGIGDSAFSGCDNLTSITIPNSMTNIGNSAFSGCSSLTSITIPNSVTSIGDYAFSDCGSLADVYYSGSEADWNAIDISYRDNGNTILDGITIHYNSTGPDNQGTGGSESSITSMVALFTGYDESTKRATFGSDPTSYTYQITNETVLSEDINSLLGKTVLVRYKTGEYGAADMLTCYVLSISPAVASSGILNNVGQESIVLGDKSYSLDRANGTAALGDLENHIRDFTVCYFYNNAIVDVRFPQKQTGTFDTGTQNNVTINGVQYAVAFTGPAPYLSAIDLWFGRTVEYWIVDGIVYGIELPDYDTTICKRLEKIEGNTAYFHDNSMYQILNSGSEDYSSLVGHWVTVTLTTSADGGTMLSNMRLFQPKISVEIEMVDDRNVRLKDDKYSYDGSDYVPSSQFEIGYQITVENKAYGVSDSDLAIMQTDPSLTLTLNDLEITPPDGFNSGRTGSGEIPNVSGTTILPGQTKVAKGYVRPGMLYFVDKEDISVTETIQMKLETSAGEYEDDVSFIIMNLDYEPPKTKEEALSSKEVKDLIEKASDELNKLDVDSGIIITDLSLAKLDFGIDDDSLKRLKKELLTEVIMSSAPEDSLSDQVADNMMSAVFGEYKSPVSGSKYTVPLRYVFETPEYGMLTVQFTCNINSFTLSGSKYALYATVDYEVLQQDKDSGDKVWPSYKKEGDFAQISFTDVKAYTDAAYNVAKEAIKEAYDDVWGRQADRIADFLFDDVVKAILKAGNTSFSKEMWKIMTWSSENMTIACPVDVFIYDENGSLSGSIENDQVTKTSTEFGLSVDGDVKYVTGLRDDHKVIYKATGNGSMDIAITEYTGYESPLRAVTFKAVPLVQDETYTQNISGEVLSEVNSYKLSSEGQDEILPDDKVLLTNLTSDESEQGEAPDTKPDPTPNPKPDDNESSDDNSGGSSGSSNSSNHYTVSVTSGIDNGSIRISPSRAERGDTVTITVDPDEGYELDTLTVTDSNGNRITTEKESDTRYTFEMPRGRVSIDAAFIAIEEEPAPQPSGEPFTDVSNRDWFYDAVEYVYETGMMNGASSNLFEPNGITTRAMIVTILHRLEGEPSVSASRFTDVAPNMYYADAVGWAQKNGIVNGTSTTAFSPNDPITREQMAAILYRYAQFKGYDISAVANLSVYRDVSQISSYALPAMQWANAEGLITGDTSVTINPLGGATRAEAATILMRFCENIA